MLKPDQVIAEAKGKENENLRFRSYLKNHADEDTLDQQFYRLHQELFQDYDCSKCRNCCKEYYGQIPEEDIPEDATHLGITPEQFKEFFLVPGEGTDYMTRHQPCDFLQEDGACMLGECRPDSCKEFPYTDKPERLFSLYSVLDAVSVCPVAFEIYERLKEEYHFHSER